MIPRTGRMSLRLFLLGSIVGLGGLFVGSAGASQLLDRNASGIHLAVNKAGIAMVTYKSRGTVRHVLARGAIDALPPTPAPGRSRSSSTTRAAGASSTSSDYWKHFRNACTPYSGQALPWLVAACTAPDGSFWALQKWQRELPDYGLTPTRAQSVWELRLSHWDTDLPSARDLPRLGLSPALRPPVRALHLHRRRRLRLQVNAPRQPAGRLGPQHLRRHVQLRLREGLEAREQLPHAPTDGGLLLRLLLAQCERRVAPLR